MNKHRITITIDKEVHDFDVVDLPHHANGHCKFEVFKNDQMVAGFEPDNQQVLHLCKNTGDLEEGLLHLLADRIERYNWYHEAKQL